MSAIYNLIITIGVISLVLPAATTIGSVSKVSDSNNETAQPFYKNLSSSLLPILLGDIWPIDEYCHDTRLNKSIEDNAVVSYLLGKSDERDRYYNSNNDDEVYLVNVKSTVLTVPTCTYSTWGYESREDLAKSGLPYMNQTLCLKQLQQLLEDTLRTQDGKSSMEAKTSNSTTVTISQVNGHVPDNILEGNIHWTGSYAMCVDDENRQFLFRTSTQMRYCLGAMKSVNWSQRQPAKETQNMNYFIRVGLCLPRSCDTRMMNEVPQLKAIAQTLANHNLISPFKLDYNLTDIYCLPDEESPLRQLDISSKVILILTTVWLAAVIYSTIFWRRDNDAVTVTSKQDINIALTTMNIDQSNDRGVDLSTGKSTLENRQVNREKGFDWIKNWSLCNHFERFTTPSSYLARPAIPEGIACKEQDSLVAFYVLDVVKVISGIWLVSSHGLIYYRGILDNNREHVQMGDSFNTAILRHGVNMVSIFFIIAGFLMSYKLFASNKPIITWKVIASRYIRLLPLYLVVYTFVKKFGPLLGSGPFWDYGMSENSERRQCSKESWFIPWLLLANFITPFAHCLITGWHLANDFQITLTIPILVTFMKKTRRSWALLLGLSLVIISSLLSSLSFYRNRSFNFGHLMLDGSSIAVRAYMARTSASYVNPIYRFGSFYMGVVLAFIIVDYEKKRRNRKCDEANQQGADIERTEIRRLTTARNLLYSMVFVVMMTFVEATPHCIKKLAYTTLGEELSRAVFKPLWTFMNEVSWFILMYHLLKVRGPESLHKILRWTGWNYLVKLNLCLILIHNEINRTLLSRQHRAIHFSWTNAYIYLITLVVVSYLVALVVHLTIECPLVAIIDHYVTKKFITGPPLVQYNSARATRKKIG